MGFCIVCKKNSIFATRKFAAGALAQSVEQRTENPCVPGSIPGGTTNEPLDIRGAFLLINKD